MFLIRRVLLGRSRVGLAPKSQYAVRDARRQKSLQSFFFAAVPSGSPLRLSTSASRNQPARVEILNDFTLLFGILYQDKSRTDLFLVLKKLTFVKITFSSLHFLFNLSLVRANWLREGRVAVSQRKGFKARRKEPFWLLFDYAIKPFQTGGGTDPSVARGTL